MILGVLSDTHGHVQRTAAAVRVLREAGAEAFVHLGDIGGTEVLDELAGLRVWLLWGNIDWPDSRLAEHAHKLGLTFASEVPLRLELGGRTLAAVHGHEPAIAPLFAPGDEGAQLRAELADYDYILCGHTHIAANVRIGPLRIVNPGALDKAPRHSVATIDLASDTVRILRIADTEPDTRPI